MQSVRWLKPGQACNQGKQRSHKRKQQQWQSCQSSVKRTRAQRHCTLHSCFSNSDDERRCWVTAHSTRKGRHHNAQPVAALKSTMSYYVCASKNNHLKECYTDMFSKNATQQVSRTGGSTTKATVQESCALELVNGHKQFRS